MTCSFCFDVCAWHKLCFYWAVNVTNQPDFIKGQSAWHHFYRFVILLTTNFPQQSLEKLTIRKKFVEEILVHPKARLTAFLMMFLETTVATKIHKKL